MTPAIRLLDQPGIAYQVHTYQHEADCTDFGLEAAQKLGIEAHRMFKTLVVRSDTGMLAMVLISVQDRVNLKNLAHALGSKKADLADPTVAEKTTGYVVGGISPLGGRKALPVFVDQKIEGQTTIFISAGKRGMQLELAPAELIKLTKATVVSLV